MVTNRRSFLGASVAAAAGRLSGGASARAMAGEEDNPSSSAGARLSNPIGVSTYSFWRFGEAEHLPIDRCIDYAAEWGFDAVEVHVHDAYDVGEGLFFLAVEGFLPEPV